MEMDSFAWNILFIRKFRPQRYQNNAFLIASPYYSLLEIMNDIGDKGEFPDSWTEALIIQIRKPEKDHT